PTEPPRLRKAAGAVDLRASIAAWACRQRHADRVAAPFRHRHAHRRRGPDETLEPHTRFGEAEVERLIGPPRQLAVDGDQIARPRRLARDDDLILAQAAVDRQ